jgi:membrane protein implicated in regulation of membrane protease activity
MDSPEQWRWLWLAAAAVFAIGEMATPGSFFLAPFAVGAFVAALLAFAGVSVTVEWIVFLAISLVVLALLRPLARRLDQSALDHGVGSRRLVGRPATVVGAIPAGDEIGMVRIDREQWRAQSIDGTAIPEGVAVRVADVQGTRLIVAPLDPAAIATPPPSLGTPTTPDSAAPAPADGEPPPPEGGAEPAAPGATATPPRGADPPDDMGPDPDKPSP